MARLMTWEMIQRIRKLDVKWAHRYMIEQSGQPFKAGKSAYSDRYDTADEVALLSLHAMRTHLGTPDQRKASKAYLKERGLKSVGLHAPLQPLLS